MIVTILKSAGTIIAILIGLAIMGLVLDVTTTLSNRTKVINCSIAEISPDFTTEMKEACRKARMNQT